jgi:hypothetical protein
VSGQDLAAQVEALRNQVEDLEALLKAAARGLGQDNDALGEGLLRLSERVEQLGGSQPNGAAGLETVTADGEGSEPESADDAEKSQKDPPPQAWVDSATAEEWRKLATWVDWLHTTYDLRANTGVPACWPAHPGVVEELAALHAAWRQAADEARPVEKDIDGVKSRGPQADTSSLIYFHDRWLHPLLTRVMSLYRIGDCRQGHQASGKGSAGGNKGAVTNPELLQVAIDLRARARHTPAATRPADVEQPVDLDSEPPLDPELEPPFDPATGEVFD